MSIQSTCCVTGHRNISEIQIPEIKEQLRQELLMAIQEGFTNFISGFARGVDLLFAEVVAELQDEGKQITLEAFVPYRGRFKTKDADFHRLIKRCSGVGLTAEVYTPTCYITRDQAMVQQSARVIAVYDGREHGGTVFTIRYSRVMERDLHMIDIKRELPKV